MKVDAIAANAPAALDTLNELAAALDDDANYASTVTTALSGKAAKDLSNVTNNTTVAGVVKTLLELLSGNNRLDGSAIKNVIPPNQAQSAYLDQDDPVLNTWYEVLNYTSGGGFFHSVIGFPQNSTAQVEFRITVDGIASTIGYDNNNIDGEIVTSTSSTFKTRVYKALLRFSSSLKVEVRRSFGVDYLESKVIYSTDL